MVRGARRGLPADARALQLLAARHRRDAARQRRALGRAARAGPDDGRHRGAVRDRRDGRAAGVRQLNHPFADSKLGREQGFLRAIGYDPRTPIAPGASFAADVLLRTPGAPGGRRNLDWDVQEVMNGASLADWLRYRAFWFSLLSQGIVRAGTANSDSHSLALEQVGYPRNIWCSASPMRLRRPCRGRMTGRARPRQVQRRRPSRPHGRHQRTRPGRHDRGRDERVSTWTGSDPRVAFRDARDQRLRPRRGFP